MMLLSLLSGPALAQQNDTSADENQQKNKTETEEEQQGERLAGLSDEEEVELRQRLEDGI